jgi:DNA primase
MTAPSRIEVVMGALKIDVARSRGRRAWALCPFHTDHDATNFFVRTTGDHAGTFHCFACKAKGNLIALVMHVRGIDFKAAKAFITTLGKNYEPPRARVRVVERPAILGRQRFALPRECIMGEPLAAWATLARRYVDSRAISAEEIERYGLGYAVDGRLAGRVVFPVRVGPRATPASYSARSFVGAERKYLTPHETEGADLDAMFGEHLWPASPDDRDVICVTEGAINALACARATDFEASSISGSDVRPGHVIKLATFDCVVLLTDPDAAGDKAARGLASSLGRRSNVVRVRLPVGKDAADLTPADLCFAINRFVQLKNTS